MANTSIAAMMNPPIITAHQSSVNLAKKPEFASAMFWLLSIAFGDSLMTGVFALMF
jgi:hypothetical protein